MVLGVVSTSRIALRKRVWQDTKCLTQTKKMLLFWSSLLIWETWTWLLLSANAFTSRNVWHIEVHDSSATFRCFLCEKTSSWNRYFERSWKIDRPMMGHPNSFLDTVFLDENALNALNVRKSSVWRQWVPPPSVSSSDSDQAIQIKRFRIQSRGTTSDPERPKCQLTELLILIMGAGTIQVLWPARRIIRIIRHMAYEPYQKIKNAKGRFKNNNLTQHGQTGAAAWKICSSILSLSQRLNRPILPAVAEGISMLRSWFCFDSSLNQHSESWQTDAQKTR